jgi:quinoprotein glucose dehydrogenase
MVQSDKIHLLKDLDGDGRADVSMVYAEGFNSITAGVAAGVLYHNGEVYATVTPDLWELKDTDGDDKADQRRSLSTGYGVHIAYGGHDMHGLCMGPDGRLYWTIADMGMNVETDGAKRLAYPNEGCVLRCNLDGSEVEVIMHGLRNPQELAFDAYGNLFTLDNDGDMGDRERWMHVVDGGDGGWRNFWQYQHDQRTWIDENLWKPAHAGQAAYILPAVANVSDGPCGLTFNPGTGLSPRYYNYFFSAHFTGFQAGSSVRAYQLETSGASFRLAKDEMFINRLVATDVEFGPDGSLFVTDWVGGWDVHDKGRIYQIHHPDHLASDLVLNTKQILETGFQNLTSDELLALLGHADRRVRQGAQFALAAQGGAIIEKLSDTALKSNNQFSRIHSIWAIGQIARAGKGETLTHLLPLLKDADSEILAQAANVLGDAGYPDAYQPFINLLEHENLRIRFFAAMGLGKIGNRAALPSIYTLLEANRNQDLYLRHAGIMALVRLNDYSSLRAVQKLSLQASPAIQMAGVIAVRKLVESGELSGRELVLLLRNIKDKEVLAEIVRTIHDVADEKWHYLLTGNSSLFAEADPIAKRVLNATYRSTDSKHVTALAQFSLQENASRDLRIEALKLLGSWMKPDPQNRITGEWQPIPERPIDSLRNAFRSIQVAILKDTDTELKALGVELCGILELRESEFQLNDLFSNPDEGVSVRVAALNALSHLKSDMLQASVSQAISSNEPALKRAGISLLVSMDPATSMPTVEQMLTYGSIDDQQEALNLLSRMKTPRADRMLVQWMNNLLNDGIQNGIRLETVAAAESRKENPELNQLLGKYRTYLESDSWNQFKGALEGGNIARGEVVFFNKPEAQCIRCHQVNGRGGTMGPQLADISQRLDRQQILESILFPNKAIAEGFETSLITMKNGTVYQGRIFEETDSQLVVETFPDDEELAFSGRLPKAVKQILDVNQIESRSRALSSMPEGIAELLSISDLRDLVEFLFTSELEEN